MSIVERRITTLKSNIQALIKNAQCIKRLSKPKVKRVYDKNTWARIKIVCIKTLAKMNGFIYRFSVCAFHSIQRNTGCSSKLLISPFVKVFKRFSNKSGVDDVKSEHAEDRSRADMYIPRRIKRRMKEKNLSMEEFEITPVYTDRLKRKTVHETLQDSVVDKVMEVDFPSDKKISIEKLQDMVPEAKTVIGRPKINPRDTSVLLFPGQGSQVVGMGQKLLPYPGVKELYEKASHMLGYDLLNLCLNGPKTELDKTIYCQPALFVTSLAGVERLKEDMPEVIHFNHSFNFKFKSLEFNKLGLYKAL